MTDNEFFKFDQECWYMEFVDAEIAQIREDTNRHGEFFEFDDIPF